MTNAPRRLTGVYIYIVVLVVTVIVICLSLLALPQSRSSVDAIELPRGPEAYTVNAGFPTSVFPSYYVQPAATTEPQPALYDPVLNITYPLNLTNPDTIPDSNDDPVSYPEPTVNLTETDATALVQEAIANVTTIVQGQESTNCAKCQDALAIGKVVAQRSPEKVPDMLVSLCQQLQFKPNATCVEDYAAANFGAIWTQVLAFADVSGLDGRSMCNHVSADFCSQPATSPLDTTGLFPKPKPADAKAPPPSGERVKVMHLSDFHLDPRYVEGSEADCSGKLCCRPEFDEAGRMLRYQDVWVPAPLYGEFRCDTPYYLALAALQSISPLTGTSATDTLAWGIYTGDLVSHDYRSALSEAYIEYMEYSVYEMFKQYIGAPVYAVLGNHDSSPEYIHAPHSMPDGLGQQFSWNYDHVAGLWQHNGWINSTGADQARLHYGAYSVKNQYGLRIITLNTDFWYRYNLLNFINMTNPDVSGMQAFLISELQKAEDAGERVWIIGHVLTGWDGTNPLPNPTDLFYQIVDHYSPHVIANIFFGHTHEDQFMIYYANNASDISAATALTTGWIGPSITPFTNLNSGFRMYEVDTGNFDIYNAYTWYANVSNFGQLNPEVTGPTFEFEYSTRETYDIGWPVDAPLNATFWHRVTEAMEEDEGEMMGVFTELQGKSSDRASGCESEACREAKVCYMRSGSVALGLACPQGFASVQN
ncbi:MAG: hypothetical protein Q9174_003590 [Haloplaca sp. 1 TL-2023]